MPGSGDDAQGDGDVISAALLVEVRRGQVDDNLLSGDAESFGLALKQRRKEMNYTQREISDLTGFSISFISDLENGKSTAEIGKAIYLANVLGLDIDIKSRGRR